MADPKAIATALLETVSAMADGHPDIGPDIDEFDCGDIKDDLPPNASAVAQVWMPIRIDGKDYAVVAYPVVE